jgi:hypothetical protein
MILLEVAGVAVVVWVVLLAVHPWGPCGRCKGRRGRGVGSTATRWNKCRKCKGRGELPRFGGRTVRKAIGRPLD